MATKLNVSIRTLLTSCEELAKDEQNYWRLRKFIKSLDTMILELTEMHDESNVNKIPIYQERLQKLKTLTNYVDNNPPTTTQRLGTGRELGENALKEVNQLQKSKQYADLRKDLLNDDNHARRRRVANDTDGSSSENMSEAVKYYNNTQEKITEHMLSLTRNLKEQTETANRIIKRDTEIVSRSAGVADRNINSLNNETEKLEQHSRNAYKCWMWLMIIFVIVVFIAMVLFMKIMKKKKA